ncbi:hypothetical protein [Desulfocicer vacuolatum]|uniref:hypothetical protein n=1 Tax=Desulfocicer vacuolatum TaxID=2298 RepID=UPI001481F95A|nr:hypothetical protein [Desulfocicer vacuolatum]
MGLKKAYPLPGSNASKEKTYFLRGENILFSMPLDKNIKKVLPEHGADHKPWQLF